MSDRFIRSFSSAAVIAATLTMAPAAFADEPAPRDVSITISPIHLILPLVEVAGEYRAAPKVGVGPIVGYGSIDVDLGDGTSATLNTWELGVSGRYYLLGDFQHGMQLGVEAVYMSVSTDSDTEQDLEVSGVAGGLAVGPYVGYKLITDVGFTFEAQLGAQYLVIDADAESDSGETASESGSELVPLLNLNVGWSF